MATFLRNGGTNDRKDDEFGINAESFSLPGNDTRGQATTHAAGSPLIVSEIHVFTTNEF